MNPSIVIRGTGLITALGRDVDTTWSALLDGGFIAEHARALLPADQEGIPKMSTWGRVDRAAFSAACEATGQRSSAGHWDEVRTSDRTALVVGTSRGPVDDWLIADRTNTVESGFGLSTVARGLAGRMGHHGGPCLTYCGACASGLHALVRAAYMIAYGQVDRALVVAAESSLHPLFIQSFRRLGVVAPAGARCRPFDLERDGLLLSEAAAAVLIERVDLPASGDILLDRYTFAGDAGHLTGFNPDGVTLRRVLRTAIDGRPVDVIHAHGTGTQANDAAEAAAIEAVLADDALRHAGGLAGRPGVYSHKGAIGHSLGASGLVSVVLNVRMHRAGRIPPNVGIEKPMDIRAAEIGIAAVTRPVRRSVACAAGFGGATAAVSLVSHSDSGLSGADPR